MARGANGGWNAERSDYRFWATSYDANGNLVTLRRRAQVQAPVHATGRGLYAETDNLRYRYQPTVSGNRLLAVDDLAPAPGLFGGRQPARPDFKDVTGARDYAYDVSGSLLSDANKQLTSIRYNFLHLPEQLVFATPGDSIRFVYSAAGQKLAKLVYEHGQPLQRTDYAGAWQYEQDTLRWLNGASGRTLREVNARSGAVRFVNEYTINDNLGNLRVAFRAGQRRTYHAGLEPGAAEQERRDFDPASVSAPIANAEQAAAGAYAAKLTAGGPAPEPIGPTKLWAVQAGDTLLVEALAHYEQAPSSGFRFTLLPFINTSLGQAPPPSSGSEGSAPKTRTYAYLQLGLSGVPALPSFGSGVPRGYLRVLLYQADSTYLDSRLVPITSAANAGWEPLRVRPWVLPQGVAYAQVYVGNESDAPVWFDELTIEHRQGLQVQENHYDPFGLELAGLNPRSPGLRQLNQYQFNGQEKQADLGLGWNHQDWRFYDAQIGRWHVVDPLADAGQEMWSTYQFGFDNALRYADADGKKPNDIYNIYSNGSINVIKNNDATDTFNVHNESGKQTASYTMDKSTASNGTPLVNFPTSGDSWVKTSENGKNYVQPQVAAAIIGASSAYREATGNKVQINQLTDANGKHSGHTANGVMADVRYANKKGNVNERVLTGGTNFDKANSQLLANSFRKFGFNKPLSIFTENSFGNGPALKGTHFPSNTFVRGQRQFSHQHHMHLNAFNQSAIIPISDPKDYPLITPAPNPPVSTFYHFPL